MKLKARLLFSSYILLNISLYAQAPDTSKTKLNIKLEELSAPEYTRAVKESGGVCIIPMGILEKHGNHLPLGTDLLDCRNLALKAAQKEYCIVFPPYYFGQINEAKHQPGTMAYSQKLIWDLLQETCDELARNGLKKIILVNGHGGNEYFVQYFCQSQLATPKDYSVILFQPDEDSISQVVSKMTKIKESGHADEVETSLMLTHRPDLVHLELAETVSGTDQKRLNMPGQYTGIWWYASYPNHYAGNGKYANTEIGNIMVNYQISQLAMLIKNYKNDTSIEQLQKQFFEQSKNPMKTKQ